MTTSLPSSPEPSSITRVACGLSGVPMDTGFVIPASIPLSSDLSLQRRRNGPVRADVVGLRVLAGHPHRWRAGIQRARQLVACDGADPDLLALAHAVLLARGGARSLGRTVPVVALAREHDPHVVGANARCPVRPGDVAVTGPVHRG